MAFEEDFPSLKEWVIIEEKADNTWIELLQKHCLDKQRVREAIDKLATNNLTSGDDSEEHKLLRTGYMGALKNMREELGL